MNENSELRRPFVIYAWFVFALGVMLLSLSIWIDPAAITTRLVLLIGAMLVAENYALEMPGIGVSLTYPLLIAVQVLCGPTATMAAALSIAVNREEIRMRLPVTVHAFNVGQLLIWNGLAAWTYVLFGGRVLTSGGSVQPFQLSEFPAMLLPIAVMMLLGVGGNLLLIAAGISLKNDVGLRDVAVQLGWLPPVQVALAGVGVLLGQVMAANMVALPLFVFPLFVARQFYQRFSKLQEAYKDTIRSIVGALEAKDPYTRGHSERVAEYATGLATAAGMSNREVSDIETAALLHDIGKLAIDGRILRKTERLSSGEWELIQSHPARGAAMVCGVAHLSHLADYVQAHHERLDGSGYPGALTGSQIPRQARILAIADSYDAMTTDRPYRPGFTSQAAMDDLRRGADVGYDADLVAQFGDWLDDAGTLQNSSSGLTTRDGEGAAT